MTVLADLEALGANLCERMVRHPAIRPRLDAVLWIGSGSRGLDVHDDSDLDLQVVMDRPNIDATSGLSDIFTSCGDVDLSVIYRADIQRPSGDVDFQDGTKGPFFIYVLASAQTLYGANPYHVLLDQLSLDRVRPSVMFTIREYLARLRVMVVLGLERSYEFKKYSLKLFKDVLVFAGSLPLVDMPAASNLDVLRLARSYRHFPSDLASALDEMIDFASPYSSAVRVRLLMEYEKMTEALSG
jgi:hypothetical protein